jgi:hypothetical protein
VIAAAAADESGWANLWWIIPLLFVFGGAILEFFGDVLSEIVKFFQGLGAGRREHKLELKRLELEIAKANAPPPPSPVKAVVPRGVPSKNTCKHKRVVPVIAADGTLAAWLCTNTRCEAQLPKGFAVYEDDL